MQERELADLANVLFIAAGLGLAFACAYLVRRPAPRTFRVWASAVAVAIPGLLLGWAVSQPELGVRAAYRGLSEALQEPLTFEAEIIVIPRPKVASGLEEGGPQGVPSLAPTVGRPVPTSESPGAVEPPDPDTTLPPPLPSATPPPPTTTPPPTSVPPTPSESPSPTPSPSPSESPPTPSPSDVIVP